MKYLATRGELKRQSEYHKIFNSGDYVEEVKTPEVCLNIVTMRTHLSDIGTCDREFVHVTDNFIYVVIDSDFIDDSAITKAIEMVGELPNLNSGTTMEFEKVDANENKISRRKRTH